QDLEVGDVVKRRRRAVVLGEVDDQPVEARRQAVVVDLRPGRRRVAAGGADPVREGTVWPGLKRGVGGGGPPAAPAEWAVDGVFELHRVDAVRHPVEAEADVALVELWVAAELLRRQVEVLDVYLDDYCVGVLAGAVTRRDDFDDRFAGRRRLWFRP